MASLKVIPLAEAVLAASRQVSFTCPHLHIVYETAARDGRYHGRCKLCGTESSVPIDCYRESSYKNRGHFHLTGQQEDADYLEFAYEKRSAG